MANNQNPTMGAPMGAGRSLGLPNQFFQGPGGLAGQQQPLPPAAMANLQAQLAGMRAQNPNAALPPMPQMGITQGPASLGTALGNMGAGGPQGWAQGSAGPSMGGLLGAGQAPGLGQQQAKLGQMAAGQMAGGAPGQGPGGQKAGGGAGMSPQMQQQIARLPGGPPAAVGPARRPRPGPGARPLRRPLG